MVNISSAFIQEGSFTSLDLHFANFICQIAGNNRIELKIASLLANQAVRAGHICADLSTFSNKECLLPDCDLTIYPPLEEWKQLLLSTKVVGTPGNFRPLVLNGSRLYLHRYWSYEQKMITFLKDRIETPNPEPIDFNRAATILDALFPGSLSETNFQKTAVASALLNRFQLISGGPGTGKTFTVARILLFFAKLMPSTRVALAAPTGKAATRLLESIKPVFTSFDCEPATSAVLPGKAFTLHRLLGPIGGSPYFRHNEKNPLPFDLIIIDEASMADVALMAKLFDAIRPSARIILLGDKDQLASVEAGAVFGDLCDTGNDHGITNQFFLQLSSLHSETGMTVADNEPPIANSIAVLKKNYRFKELSGIGELARLINNGDSSAVIKMLESGSAHDIEWNNITSELNLYRQLRTITNLQYSMEFETPEQAFKHFLSFRILCALRNGPTGVISINKSIERFLGVSEKELWYHGKPIMVTMNDYSLGLFNGDIGIVMPDPLNSTILKTYFQTENSELRCVLPRRVQYCESVYAMTIHKSQGSEFNEVLTILPFNESPVLTRELLYTGITRARKKVTIWGTAEIIESTVRKNIVRNSGIKDAFWNSARK